MARALIERFLPLLLLCVMIAGCRAVGGIERVGDEMLAPQPLHAVELYIDRMPTRPYSVIARVRGEADSRTWVSLPETEAAAFDALRSMAARVGAHAVIDIERTILRDGVPVMTDAPPDPTPVQGTYVVRMSGRAVIFRN